MNRIKSFLMAAVILITGINFQGLAVNAQAGTEISSVSTEAEAGAEISSGSIEAEAGKVVSVPINIGGNPGIMGFTINITYDKEAFTPIEATPSALLSEGNFQDSIETSGTDSFQVTWAGSSDMNEDGILFYVTFRVAEYAKGDYKLKLSYGQPDTFNEKWEDVALGCKDISVTVTALIPEKEKQISPHQITLQGSFRKKRGDDAFDLNAKSPTGAVLGFVSDNNKVVQVDAEGKVKITGVGTANITVSAPEDKEHKAFSTNTVVTVVPDAVTGLKLKSVSAGTVLASWNQESPYSGYEIRCSVKSNMSSNAKTLQFRGKSAEIKGLSGKIYYVQIRAFEEADGILYYGDWSGNGSIIVKPETVGGVKIKPQAGGKARISWKKASDVSGYQVRYSLKSNMKSGKTIKIKGGSKTKATLKKLGKKKKYYVQVRAYRKVGKKTCYGNWSKKGKMKVK